MTTQSVDKNAGGASSLEGMESIFAVALKMAGNKDDKPKEEKLDPQSYENALNELAVSLSGSVDVGKRMLVGISGTDKNKDLFKTLVEYKLKQQLEDGKQPSLQEAISSATDDLRNRSEHALRDDQDGDKKADVLNGYWDRQKGKDQAAEASAPMPTRISSTRICPTPPTPTTTTTSMRWPRRWSGAPTSTSAPSPWPSASTVHWPRCTRS